MGVNVRREEKMANQSRVEQSSSARGKRCREIDVRLIYLPLDSPRDCRMRILVADHQPLFRDALRALLEEHGHEVVAEAATCADAVVLTIEHTPDVLLLDVCEPLPLLIATTRELVAKAPDTAVIILTDRAEEMVLFRAIGAGAKGYLTKELDGDRFCELLSRVESGGPALTPHLASRLLQAFVESENAPKAPQDPAGLTEREHEVLDTMAQGVTSNRELATTLQVSENTVRFHVRNILDKLNLHTRAAAIAFALTHGIVEGRQEVESPR